LSSADYDAIVCGGGVAGLAAALWLGRYRRKTLLLDAGEQRNLPADRAHGYLTRDGATPQTILAKAKEEVENYETVDIQPLNAVSARRSGNSFAVETTDGPFTAQRLILCTGVQDEHPDIPGFEELYGTSLFHCPCCDGYEACGLDVVVIGWGEHVAGYALDLLEWGARVTVITNGESFQGDDACAVTLETHAVAVIEEKVARYDAEDGKMRALHLESGNVVEAQMGFFSIAHHPRTELAESLGCSLDADGYIEVGPHGETNVEGVFAAGDVTPGEQMVQVAASQGLIAGIQCARSLRGGSTAFGAPDPGPDSKAELDRARDEV